MRLGSYPLATSSLPGSAVVVALGQGADGVNGSVDFNGVNDGDGRVGGNGGGGESHDGDGQEAEMHFERVAFDKI